MINGASCRMVGVCECCVYVLCVGVDVGAHVGVGVGVGVDVGVCLRVYLRVCVFAT